MGREIRMVPPNWEHPKVSKYDYRLGMMVESYQPMFDGDLESRMRDWEQDFAKWKDGGLAECIKKHPEYGYKIDEPYRSFCEWNGEPPDPKYYLPSWPEGTATWFQAYETVSEGTPVSPPFATEDELIQYLAENGDFWDQKRRAEGRCSMPCGPWGREAAERFVKRGHAFSMVVESTASGVVVKGPSEQ